MLVFLIGFILSASTVQIQNLSYVDEGKVTVADLLQTDLKPEEIKKLRNIELFDDLSSYSYQVFTKNFLVDILKKANISMDAKVIVPEKAYVVSKTNYWTRKNIENNLKIEFKKICGECDIDVKLLQFKKYKDAISWDFEVHPSIRNQRLYIPANVQVLENNKLENRTTNVVAEVYYRKDVPVLRSNKKRGEMIHSNDVVMKKILLPSHSNFYSTIDDVVGKQANKTLSQGQLILFNDVKKQIAIRRGEQVQATVKSNNIEIVLSVIARESGALGDVIRVEIPSNKKHMQAKIKSFSEVEIK